MQLIHPVASLRALVKQWREQGQPIALVPTMGNLHAGHLALVTKAQQLGHKVIVSIFVNPLQFGPNEDFARYPRTLNADCALLAEHGVDAVFAPDVDEIYPHGLTGHTEVRLPLFDQQLCALTRPGHFTGVATVVTKLFNLVQPDLALFGEKDFQQLTVIRQLVKDLCLPIRIVAVPTLRDASGLALSSRNGYLTEAEKSQAAGLYHCLQQTAAQLAHSSDWRQLEATQLDALRAAGFEPDYLQICDPEQLLPTQNHPHPVILVAARLGSTRLIDNLAL